MVYCKAPLPGPEQVLRYLGRYIHRIAIGNERLIELQDGHVSFRYQDRARRRRRVLRLPAGEFIRRFLLHSLPRGLVRVRHYGLLANGVKSQRLALCRRLLGAPRVPEPTHEGKPSWADIYKRLVGRDPLLCPYCRTGHLIVVADIPAAMMPPTAVHVAPRALPRP